MRIEMKRETLVEMLKFSSIFGMDAILSVDNGAIESIQVDASNVALGKMILYDGFTSEENTTFAFMIDDVLPTLTKVKDELVSITDGLEFTIGKALIQIPKVIKKQHKGMNLKFDSEITCTEKEFANAFNIIAQKDVSAITIIVDNGEAFLFGNKDNDSSIKVKLDAECIGKAKTKLSIDYMKDFVKILRDTNELRIIFDTNTPVIMLVDHTPLMYEFIIAPRIE